MIVTLVFCLGKAGDLILSTPLFEALHEAEPELRFILITSPQNKPILQGHPQICEIRTFDSSSSWKEKWHFIKNLRNLNPIYSFSLSPQPISHWLSYFTSAGIRGGILQANQIFSRLFASWLLHQRVWLFSKNPEKVLHKTHAFLKLAQKMGFFFKNEKRPLTLPIFKKNLLEKVPPPKVLLHLGKGWLKNGWRREDLLAFIQGISAKIPPASLVLTAYEDEIDFTANEVKSARLFRDLSFGEWATLIARSAVVITQDDRAVQVADAQRTPVIIVYAREKKAAFYKESGPLDVPHRALGQKNWTETREEIFRSLKEFFPFSKDFFI